MGLRFRRRIKICKGLYLNIGKKSTSVSVGTKGAHYTVGSNGRKSVSVGIPGTGVSYTSSIQTAKTKHKISNNVNGGSGNFPSPSGKDDRNNPGCLHILGTLLLYVFILPVGVYVSIRKLKAPKILKIIAVLVATILYIGIIGSMPSTSSSESKGSTATVQGESIGSANGTIETEKAPTAQKETEATSEESAPISKDSVRYHVNDRINWFINQYNIEAENPITDEILANNWMNRKDRIAFKLDEGCNMKLYGQSDRLLVYISCESPDYSNESTAWFPVFDAVMNVFFS